MLANRFIRVRSGNFDETIHLPAASKTGIVEFIGKEIPRWRDFLNRPSESSETKLTEHLCNFLNSAAYCSDEWNHIQFQTETADETAGNRKIDLTVKPLACEIIIGNKRHTIFQALFPVECKRLPTPKGKDRDEREYVVTAKGATGGIQRFKLGHHGAEHDFAAMIGYVQQETFEYWLKKVNGWILKLSIDPGKPWNKTDIVKKLSIDSISRCYLMSSVHERSGTLNSITIRHLWIDLS